MSRSRIRTLLLILIATIGVGASISSTSIAAEKTAATKKAKKKSKKKKNKVNDSTLEANTTPLGTPSDSSSSRKELLGNIGLSPSPLMGLGGTFGIIKDSGSGGELSLTYAAGKSGTIGAKVMHVGGRYRMGLIKVGYIAGGVGLRMASGNWYVLNQTQDAEYSASASLNAVTFDGAIGTQFKLGSFAIGADLVGFSFPIFKMGVKSTKPTEEDYDEADANAQQEKFNKLAAGLNLTLLKVGIGFMF